MEPRLPQNVDNDALNMAKAIRSVESNHKYNLRGASGEFGAYQWMPDTWKVHAKQYFGDENAPLTPKNQDFVAYNEIKRMKDQGYTPAMIAATWNSGSPTGWETKKGVNKYGVAYDVPAYVNKVGAAYRQIKGSSQAMPAQVPVQPVEQKKTLGGFAGNVLKSGGRLIEGTVDALIHPFRTVNTLGKVGLGTLSNIGEFLGLDSGQGENNQLVDEIARMYKQRYGKDLGKTIYEDPVGVLADLSVVLGGAAGLAGKIGKLGGATETANLASKVGGFANKIDPLQMAGRGLSKIGVTPGNIAGKVGTLASDALGVTTGQGGEVIRQVFGSARKGSKAAQNAMRGAVTEDDIIKNAKLAKQAIEKNRSEIFPGLDLKNTGKTHDITPVYKAFSDKLDEFGVTVKPNGELDFTTAGLTSKDESRIKELDSALKSYAQLPPDKLNSQVVQNLKKKAANLYDDSSQVRGFAETVRKGVDDILSADIEGYRQANEDFSQLSGLIKELNKELSLKNENTSTTFRKLVNTLKGANNEKRARLVAVLDKYGAGDILDQIAGLNVSKMTSNGITPSFLGGGLAFSDLATPAKIAGLPAFSPRLVGEGANLAGKAVGKIEKLKLPDTKIGNATKAVGSQVYKPENYTRNALLLKLIEDAQNESDEPQSE